MGREPGIGEGKEGRRREDRKVSTCKSTETHSLKLHQSCAVHTHVHFYTDPSIDISIHILYTLSRHLCWLLSQLLGFRELLKDI